MFLPNPILEINHVQAAETIHVYSPSWYMYGFCFYIPSVLKTINNIPTFVGLHNFRYLFSDPVFKQSLSNNAKLLLAVPILVFGCLLIAMLLFERIKGWQFYRNALFIPFLLSIVVVGTVFSYIYTLHGALNQVLEFLHLNFLAQDWLGSSKLVIPSIISVIVYREMGFGFVLYLARLMSINEELFELVAASTLYRYTTITWNHGILHSHSDHYGFFTGI